MRLALAALVLLATAADGLAAASERRIAPLAGAERSVATHETAVLAGGCFWGVEGVFEQVRGVRRVVSGYAGGRDRDPTYAEVSSGTTGAAEAVRIDFDPRVVSYADLLQIYFSVATDPTQLNRQGPDVGTQYRGAIFPVGAAQAQQARAYLAQLKARSPYGRPVVTTIESGRFVAAEAYHQDFMRLNPRHPYILVHDRPKIAALRRLFPDRLR